jgi:hypothetical protein
MAGPDRRKIREWMIAECLRRRSVGVSDEALFAWMMGEGYDEMESLTMLAEGLGWNGAGLRAKPFWPRLSPRQKVDLLRATRGAAPDSFPRIERQTRRYLRKPDRNI